MNKQENQFSFDNSWLNKALVFRWLYTDKNNSLVNENIL